jgi:hypothetical protein
MLAKWEKRTIGTNTEGSNTKGKYVIPIFG